MNNSEKVQAALAALRKRWIEMHDGKTAEERRHPATLRAASEYLNDDPDDSPPIEVR
ncbi:Uncharacterised protein [Burkholderia pseudomallei]|uniref:hypothetical protein n=1 Tax=Burkholderia pseudomallei TaxID=28450 RepID=UPI000F1A2F9C|nr:hypothetical protein [Burkholderia pseudomallei]VBM56234.1 Uncharacterised protein [Burkholderia pseudomallei]